jgi:hypothetical protein
MKKPRNYNPNHNQNVNKEEEVLTPEMEIELSNGKEEGEE